MFKPENNLIEAFKKAKKEQPPEIFKKIENLSVLSSADFHEKFRILHKLAYFIMETRMNDWSYDEELDDIKYLDQVFSSLKLIISSKNGSDNYFLKEFAKTIYEKSGDIENLSQNIHKFEITENVFSWHLGDTIRISSSKNHEYIEELFLHREKLWDELEKVESEETVLEPKKDEIAEEIFTVEATLDAQFSKELGVDDLIVSRKTPSDEADFKYFLLFSDEPMKNIIEKQFGIEVKKLSLSEQFRFLQYIKNHTVDEMYSVEKFIQTFNIFGARTFLSVEHGGKEMGDKILELGEVLPKEVAEKIFNKYSEIVDITNSIEDNFYDFFKNNKNVSREQIGGIKESLLIRAKDLLFTFYEKKENNIEDLLKDLERYKSEIFLYADIYKKLKQSGKEVKLEDVKNTEIVILSQEEKEKLADKFWDITKANRPFIKDADKIEKRKNDFFSSINNQDSNFYILRHKGDIVAFCSFTPDDNGDFYVESLNVESEIKGVQIGNEFFSVVLEKVKNLGHDIYGHVHALNKETLSYYERLGFIVTEVQINRETKYEIRIPKTLKRVA